MQDAVDARARRGRLRALRDSAFAQPGRECRHNLNYWRFGDYLGIGAGAHSKISFPDRIVREVRYKQPQQYLEQVAAGAPVHEQTHVTRDDVGFEFMLNALRLTDGVPASLFAERTGFPLASIAARNRRSGARGLLDADPALLKPTELGRRFLNDLQALFLRSDRSRDAGGSAQVIAAPVAPSANGAHDVMSTELFHRPLRAIAAGEATAPAFAEAQLARVAATDAGIGAWAHLDPAHVRHEAQRCDARACARPLRGCGIGVKDIIATRRSADADGLAGLRGTIGRATTRRASRG